MPTACLKRIATALPKYDRKNAFIVFAEQMLADLRPPARVGLFCLGRWM